MRKTLCALLALALGAMLAFIGVAAPAAAHHNTVSASAVCAADLSYTVSWSVTNSEGISETIISSSDTALVPVGTVIGPRETKTFTRTVTVPTAVTLTLGARWTNGVTATSHGSISAAAFPSGCAYPAGYELDCEQVTVDHGRALREGDHINMDITVDGETFQRSAYVDKNIAGGWNTLGLRINGFDPIPLTEQQVRTGRIVFEYSTTLDVEVFTVEWVQMNSSYFNQDRSSVRFLHCGEAEQLTVRAEPSATPPSCTADGTLVIPAQEHVVFSGGEDGDGPGQYLITAASDSEQYALVGTVQWPITVQPKLTGPECAEVVSLPLDPYATPESCIAATGEGEQRGAAADPDGRLPGLITILHEEHVVFAVDGEIVEPEVDESTEWPFWESYEYAAGTYQVTASVEEEFRFVPEGPASWTVVVEEPESVPCNVGNVEHVPASASAADGECTEEGRVSAAITVGLVDGVSYYIDGVEATAATTPVAAGSHVVTALAGPGLQIDGQHSWEFEVDAAEGGCAELAVTGVSGTGWTAGLALFTVLLGAGAVLGARRARRGLG